MTQATQFTPEPLPTLRKPSAEDGARIWELIQACKPLDENSMYCNLIQCHHFRDTCILAELKGGVVGWISGYIRPDDPETLFVWQVAVSEKARGAGVGRLMLRGLLAREDCAGINRIQTTITRDNEASWALFRRFARHTGGRFDSMAYFTQSLHFKGQHDSEYMVTIDLQAEAGKRAA